MPQLYPAEIRLTEEEVVALDEACAIWGLAGGDGRSRFIQRCLRYGLLSLLDAGVSGVRDISEAAEPEFVQDCRGIEARLSAAGALRDGANDAPGIHGIQKGLSTGDSGVPAAAVPACGKGGAGGIKAATCAADWPAGLDWRRRSEFLGLFARNRSVPSSPEPPPGCLVGTPHPAVPDAAACGAARRGLDKTCLLYTSPSPRD